MCSEKIPWYLIFLTVCFTAMVVAEIVVSRTKESQVGKCSVITYKGDVYVKGIPECRMLLEILSKEGSL